MNVIVNKSITERWPHLCWAALEMSYAIGGMRCGRTDVEFYTDLEGFLGAEGVYAADLDAIDAFIGTLYAHEVATLVDGDEEDMLVLTKRFPDPEKLRGLLNDIFENVA